LRRKRISQPAATIATNAAPRPVASFVRDNPVADELEPVPVFGALELVLPLPVAEVELGDGASLWAGMEAKCSEVSRARSS